MGLVGASRFELETSCAQGRRATRLRYAPTNLKKDILAQFLASRQIGVAIYDLRLMIESFGSCRRRERTAQAR